jgi:hypothetical protein
MQVIINTILIYQNPAIKTIKINKLAEETKYKLEHKKDYIYVEVSSSYYTGLALHILKIQKIWRMFEQRKITWKHSFVKRDGDPEDTLSLMKLFIKRLKKGNKNKTLICSSTACLAKKYQRGFGNSLKDDYLITHNLIRPNTEISL